MIKSKPATVSVDRLKSFVERINNLLDEKQGLADDVGDIYLEAKKAGANTKALRKVIAKRRAKKPDPEVEAAMEAYDLALDEAAAMVSNGSTSLRRAATKTGFSKSAIQRQVSHRKENSGSGTEHDPDTGEISNAAPGACVDGPSVHLPAETIVPRPCPPQAGEAATLLVTPVTNEGVGTGNQSETGEREGASQADENRLDTPLSPPLSNREREARSGATSSEQEALAAGEGEELRAGLDTGSDTTADNSNAVNLAGPLGCGSNDREPACPSTPPQRGGCSTDVVSMQHEIGAVAEPSSAPRVATDEIDLTPPPRLLAKRREIEERRSASQ